jgi:predicted amidohydrolase YtcJ
VGKQSRTNVRERLAASSGTRVDDTWGAEYFYYGLSEDLNSGWTGRSAAYPDKVLTLHADRGTLMQFRQAAFAAALLTSTASIGLAQEPADRIFTGGPVLTMNDAQPRAGAVAVKNGRIVAVGTPEEIAAYRGQGTEVTDLAGRALIPGFFDAHGHVTAGGVQALTANLLSPPDGEVTDIASLQQVLRDWAEENRATVEQVGLIMGFGYDNSQLAELRHPTRADLDAVSTEFPIYIIHQSGHIGVANSKALEMLGITAASENPPGGLILKDAAGEPTGVLEENASFAAIPGLFSNVGLDGLKTIVAAGADLWARYGYTTAQEGRSLPGSIAVLAAVAAEGGLRIDVMTHVDVISGRDFILENVSADYVNRFRVAGAKLTIDGSPQGFTALRDRPYYAPVGIYPPGYLGYASVTQTQVDDAVEWAYANDIQILAHANGEGAQDMLIAAVTAASERHGMADRRTTLIHGQFAREDQVDSYKRLGVIPSFFPMHTFYWGDWHRDHTVGPALADNISPTGWAVKRGMIFTSHHDAPVAFPDSMRVLDATVTRRSRSGDIIGPDQRVDVITALKAMTLWPAFQYFEEDQKGSIEVGKLADLVILSHDPTAVDPETLDQLVVTETIKEGDTVYAAVERDGRLDYRPQPDGTDPYADFLRALAINRDMGGASGKGISSRVFASAPHSSACVAATLTAMLTEGLERSAN